MNNLEFLGSIGSNKFGSLPLPGDAEEVKSVGLPLVARVGPTE